MVESHFIQNRKDHYWKELSNCKDDSIFSAGSKYAFLFFLCSGFVISAVITAQYFRVYLISMTQYPKFLRPNAIDSTIPCLKNRYDKLHCFLWQAYVSMHARNAK